MMQLAVKTSVWFTESPLKILNGRNGRNMKELNMRLIMVQTVDHRVAAQGAASNECQVVKWVQRAKNVEVEVDLHRRPSLQNK